MRLYTKEFKLLENIRSTVKSEFPRLGINKKQEIIRLLYETAKKDSSSPQAILKGIDSVDFNKIKLFLLKKRFPQSYLKNEISRPYLPKIELENSSILDLKKRDFYPKRILAERPAQSSTLADRFRKSFPEAEFSEIESLKEYLKKKRRLTTKDYNNRCDTVFITRENYDFFKKCPCTKKAVGCGYHIFNLSFGCIFECTYCYLQEYTDTPGLIFPANIDKFFRVFNSYKKPGMRIGTGEFSDSLMLDHLTEYSFPIIEFFKKHPRMTFEFKTKSVNIGNLLKANHAGNIVISWTLNPQRIIDENEFFLPSLEKRISSAKNCSKAGYKLSFHFDPVIYFKGWEKEYRKVIDLLFLAINPEDIAWISIGSLRFNPNVKKIIEARFPGNKILDEELMLGFDNKLRYPYSLRQKLYGAILNMLFKHSKRLRIYLCMEDSSMWRNFKKYLRP